MRAGKNPVGDWTHDAALRPQVRRPGSMDAFLKPSVILGKRVYHERTFSDEEREGLSYQGDAGEHPAGRADG